jgi:hypothetical protein
MPPTDRRLTDEQITDALNEAYVLNYTSQDSVDIVDLPGISGAMLFAFKYLRSPNIGAWFKHATDADRQQTLDIWVDSLGTFYVPPDVVAANS